MCDALRPPQRGHAGSPDAAPPPLRESPVGGVAMRLAPSDGSQSPRRDPQSWQYKLLSGFCAPQFLQDFTGANGT